MENYTKRLPLALFSAYVIKLMIQGATFADGVAILILAAVYAINEHKLQNSQFTELKQELTKIKEDIELAKKSAEDAKTSIVGMKMQGGFKMSSVK